MKDVMKNKAVSILKKVHENIKDDDTGISKHVDDFIRKSEKLRNFKFL